MNIYEIIHLINIPFWAYLEYSQAFSATIIFNNNTNNNSNNIHIPFTYAHVQKKDKKQKYVDKNTQKKTTVTLKACTKCMYKIYRFKIVT